MSLSSGSISLSLFKRNSAMNLRWIFLINAKICHTSPTANLKSSYHESPDTGLMVDCKKKPRRAGLLIPMDGRHPPTHSKDTSRTLFIIHQHVAYSFRISYHNSTNPFLLATTSFRCNACSFPMWSTNSTPSPRRIGAIVIRMSSARFK